MNQNYNFKSLQYSEDNKEQETNPDDIKVFETGQTKTIDFVQKDGTRQSFSYGHFMTAWMGIKDDERFIKIFFATHLITIKGYCLDPIYDHFINQYLKILRVSDERYLDQVKEHEPFIVEINIVWKKEDK